MARQYGGWVRAHDTSTATVTKTVQLAADAPAGAVIVVGIYNRTNTTATLVGVSDPVNGTWSANVDGPHNIGASTRAWFVVLENTAALTGTSNRTITVETSVGVSTSIVAGWVDDDTVTLEFDQFATAVISASNQTNWDTNTLAVPGAGALVGFLAMGNSQGTTAPTMDGAGETLRTTVSDASSFRTNLITEDIASAGTYGLETTAAFTTPGGYMLASLVEPGGGGASIVPLLHRHFSQMKN